MRSFCLVFLRYVLKEIHGYITDLPYESYVLQTILGLCKLSGKTTYRKISPSFDIARQGV